MPSACFRSLCKQIVKLHEAISDLLPTIQVYVSLHESVAHQLLSHVIISYFSSDRVEFVIRFC